MKITSHEKKRLRELARKQLDYARLPVMRERERLWYLHNDSRGERPMVVMEEATFLNEILPPLECEDSGTREIEKQLLQNIAVHELIGDDKVIPDAFYVYKSIDAVCLGQTQKITYAAEGLGYHIEPAIEELEAGFEKLSPSIFEYCKERTEALADLAGETIGDILPVEYKNNYNHWAFGITGKIVALMGMENMFCEMAASPRLFHKLMRLLTDDMIRCLRWEEENGLLLLNNANDYMGSGSYCFTRLLPQPDFNGKARSIDTWGHLNSQESVGVSPGMYREFIYPYYAEIAGQFGRLYYGCCEPVHEYWDNCIQLLPNIKKISISAWCDERFMSERLQGSGVIYSRKPFPNYIGVEKELDEAAFSSHIKATACLIKDFNAEFIFRDIYKLNGSIEKVRRAVEITRNLTENAYC